MEVEKFVYCNCELVIVLFAEICTSRDVDRITKNE